MTDADMGTGADALLIEVISDVVCPWCYLGKRRLEQAAAATAIPLTIRWRPFQLDGTIPPEGKPRRDYLQQKFGSAERIKQIYDGITATGAAEGIPFAFDRIEVSPNTLDAHRVIRWAEADGLQDAVVEALFRAYFIEGRDIGDRSVLADTAASVGMNRTEVARRLATPEDRDAVRGEVERAQRMGVTGVPTFVVGERYAIVGAQPADEIAAALQTIAAAPARQERLQA